MSARKNNTAPYKIITDAEGSRYRFFCELSGAAVCTTKLVCADTQAEELRLAWKNEGRQMFNKCPKCGRWVSDVMFNADVMECVDCSPWEHFPNFCPECGQKISNSNEFCHSCGAKLQYGWRDET